MVNFNNGCKSVQCTCACDLSARLSYLIHQGPVSQRFVINQASFLNTQFAIELRLMSIVQLITALCDTGPRYFDCFIYQISVHIEIPPYIQHIKPFKSVYMGTEGPLNTNRPLNYFIGFNENMFVLLLSF